MNYENKLNQIINKLENGLDKNWIIIGDNSSGKSELLNKYIERRKSKMYFIDAVNRCFNVREIRLTEEQLVYKESIETIIKCRIDKEFFNLKDSFGTQGHIERLYQMYSESLHNFILRYLGIDLQFAREKHGDGFGDGDIQAFVNGNVVELSNGYQGLLRIFAELIMFHEVFKEKGTIVIDEIDEFLSPNQSFTILQFLVEQFPDSRFIVTTHSNDLICGSKGCNIVALGEEQYQLLDSNDYTSYTDVATLFKSVFGNLKGWKNDKSEMDELLRKLLEIKLSNCWGDENERELQEIDGNELTLVQKMIWNQIRGWH